MTFCGKSVLRAVKKRFTNFAIKISEQECCEYKKTLTQRKKLYLFINFINGN